MKKGPEFRYSGVISLVVQISFFMLCSGLSGQSPTDSLYTELKMAKTDTQRIFLRAQLGEMIPILRLGYWDSLRIDAASLNMKKIEAQSINNIGYIYDDQGNIEKAFEYYTEGLKRREELDDKYGIAESLNNLSLTFERRGDIPDALDYQFRALKIQEEIGDSSGISRSLLNIAHIYEDQDDIVKALEYYANSLRIAEMVGDLTLVGTVLNNVGLIYRLKGSVATDKSRDSLYSMAINYLNKALTIFKELNDIEGVATIYQNFGMIAQDNLKFPEAKDYYEKSLDLWMRIDNKRGLTFVLNNLGSIYQVEGNLSEALKFGNRALSIGHELGYPQDISLSAKLLSEIYQEQERWHDAFKMQQLFYTMNDSIRNESTRRASMRKQFEYEYEKKETQLKSEQEKERIIAEERARKQKIIIWTSVSGLSMVIVFAVFIYRSLRITKRQKHTIEIKNRETEIQKKIIEEKNKDITDSINYAKRIQQAKLPVKDEIYSSLPQSFILFKPKDIVSGDFYYFRKTNKHVLLAAADCTGHGVPGAFMSLIGSEKLDEAISRSDDTSEILKQLNNGIRISLHQSDSRDSTRDGMDIALVSINNEQRKLRFAGANRPMWIIRNGIKEIEEILPTKTAIGGYTEADQQFDSHDITLNTGDSIYIFSDGYADTYSGKDGKKLKTKKFKELLLEISEKDMSFQEKYLDNFIEEWKAGIDQIDDILVIGIKF